VNAPGGLAGAARDALKRHWPEHLIEAAALGIFMVSACSFAALLEHPASPVHRALPLAVVRRVLMGVAMGLTAVALIYSPWGRRSGAYMNPSVTLTFYRLGRSSSGTPCSTSWRSSSAGWPACCS
jgi:aquaporin Z